MGREFGIPAIVGCDDATLPVDGTGLARLEFILTALVGVHPLAPICAAVYLPPADPRPPLGPRVQRVPGAAGRTPARARGGEPDDRLTRRLPPRGPTFLPAFGTGCDALPSVRQMIGLDDLQVTIPFCRAPRDRGLEIGFCGQAPPEHPEEVPELLAEGGISYVSVTPDTVVRVRRAGGRRTRARGGPSFSRVWRTLENSQDADVRPVLLRPSSACSRWREYAEDLQRRQPLADPTPPSREATLPPSASPVFPGM